MILHRGAMFSGLLLLAAGTTAWAQETVHVVLLVYQATNTGSLEASKAVAFCTLPTSGRYQQVIDLQVDPSPAETRTDKEAQQVVAVPLGPVPASQTRSVRVMA